MLTRPLEDSQHLPADRSGRPGRRTAHTAGGRQCLGSKWLGSWRPKGLKARQPDGRKRCRRSPRSSLAGRKGPWSRMERLGSTLRSHRRVRPNRLASDHRAPAPVNEVREARSEAVHSFNRAPKSSRAICREAGAFNRRQREAGPPVWPATRGRRRPEREAGLSCRRRCWRPPDARSVRSHLASTERLPPCPPQWVGCTAVPKAAVGAGMARRLIGHEYHWGSGVIALLPEPGIGARRLCRPPMRTTWGVVAQASSLFRSIVSERTTTLPPFEICPLTRW
jgi:hypothetical protein